MNIKFSPQRRDDTLTVSKLGDILTINGVTYDFAPLLDGATLPSSAIACEWIVGDVERTNGVLELTLLLPNGPNATEQQKFPEPLVNPPDGDLVFPPDAIEE